MIFFSSIIIPFLLFVNTEKSNYSEKIPDSNFSIDMIYIPGGEFKMGNKNKNSANCFAKRFAAKEAFSKALGTGIAKGINFKEIIILNEKNGKPYIKLIDETKKVVDRKLKKKNYKINLLDRV